jgi:hypothetical protein
MARYLLREPEGLAESPVAYHAGTCGIWGVSSPREEERMKIFGFG